MKQVCAIGLDIAKHVFQVHGVDSNSKQLFNKKISRSNMKAFFANTPLCLIGIEACGGAHYWARELQKLGHTVKLIPPHIVKPFVMRCKTDAADALAICEVVRRLGTKFVSVKTEEQQDLTCMMWNAEESVSDRDRRKLWLREVTLRRGKFCASVAQANKTARILWNVLAKGEEKMPTQYKRCGGGLRRATVGAILARRIHSITS